MRVLPEGWVETELSDVCNLIRGITFPSSAKESNHTPSNVCCLRTSNIQREVVWHDIYFVPREYVKRDDQFVQSGDILMSMANSYELVGKVAIAKNVPYTTAFGAFLAAIRPRIDILGQYLFHLLRTAQVQSELRSGSSQTVNIANISVKALSSILIPLPPLNEQKRIADKLDTLLAKVDACRERLDRVPQVLKRFRQAVLAAATSGGLTEEWRGKNLPSPGAPRHPLPKGEGKILPTDLPPLHEGEGRGEGEELPEGWERIKVSNLLIEKPRNGYSPKAVDFETPIKSLTLTATTSGRFNSVHSKYINETIPKESHLWLKPGDILIQRANTIEYVGVSAIYDGPFGKFIYPDLMMKCRANDRVLTTYLHYVLSSEAVRKYFRENATGTSGNMPKINQQTILTATAALPPLPEQQEIVRRVENLFAFADRLEARYATARKQVDQLTPSLLAKAFRGELVPQDPADEPAEKLLERIKAAKDKTLPPPAPPKTGGEL